MATATLVQSRTIAPGNADWTQSLGFGQFDPAFGTLLDVRITIESNIAGSALIENLGATPASVQLRLSETVLVSGAGGQVLVAGGTVAGSGAYLAASDGTIDLNGGGHSGRTISNIVGATANTGTYAAGTSGFGAFLGTGSIALTTRGSLASTETGNGNLLSLIEAQAGATVTVQFDYTPPSGGGGDGSGGSGTTISIGPNQSPEILGPNETVTPTQTLVVPDALTGWSATAAAAQFNPNLGTLKAVILTLTGDINSGLAAENLGSAAASISMTDSAYVALTLANGTLITANPTVQTGSVLAAYDGTTDFGGSSGIDATGLTASQSGTTWIGDTSDLASFTGNGTIALPLSAIATSSVGGSADLTTRLRTLAGATVGIGYVYIAGTSAAVTAPVVVGTAAGQTTTDRATIAPFSGVTISDANAGATQTLTIALSSALNGKLSNLGGGSYNAATGVYSDSGTAAAITADVRGLIFTPTRELNLGGLATATVFTVQDTDSTGGSVSDSNTSVFATAVVVPPTITGTVARQTVTAPGSIALFAGVAIGDDMAYPTDKLTVTMSAATNGVLTNLGGGTYDAATGVYTATGSPTAVTADLDGLIFTPTSFAVAPNTQTTGFTIDVTDIYGAAASSRTTSVVAAVNPSSHCLFQNNNGQLALWQIVGTGLQAANPIGPNPGSSWFAKGSGAFYAGDTADVVWQNQDGTVAIWQVQGTAVVGGAIVSPNPGPAWHIAGTGDFYGDGNTALLWQSDSGLVGLWDMNGATIAQAALFAPNVGQAWHIVGKGDFYGDGNTDILWHNDNGAVAIWDVHGTTIAHAGLVAINPGPAWQIKGTGDFYGDGHADILWQNASGTVGIWEMNGTTVAKAALVALDPGPVWHIVGTGDFNNDGKTDIVLQSDSGAVADWEMNGNTVSAGAILATPGSSWNVLGAGDSMRFIYSGEGNETLSAVSTIAEEFVFAAAAAGVHTVIDFNPEQDSIALSAASFPDFGAVQHAIAAIPGGAMIDLGNSGSLLLPGVDQTSLHASNFILR